MYDIIRDGEVTLKSISVQDTICCEKSILLQDAASNKKSILLQNTRYFKNRYLR